MEKMEKKKKEGNHGKKSKQEMRREKGQGFSSKDTTKPAIIHSRFLDPHTYCYCYCSDQGYVAIETV
jgi:hypothetical protein